MQPLWPTLAYRFAYRLFTTPIRFPHIAWKRPPEKVEQGGLKENQSYTLYSWPCSGPRILLLHGWSGQAAQLGTLATAMFNAGYSVFALEAPGHGSNKSNQSNALEMAQAVMAVEKSHGPFYACVGHSLGGLALFLALEMGLSCKKLVTIGMPTLASEVLAAFCQLVGLKPAFKDYFERRFLRFYGRSFESYSAIETMKRTDFLPDHFLVHDIEDREVSIANARALLAEAPKIKSLFTRGLGHVRLLKDEKTVNAILAYLNQ